MMIIIIVMARGQFQYAIKSKIHADIDSNAIADRDGGSDAVADAPFCNSTRMILSRPFQHAIRRGV